MSGPQKPRSMSTDLVSWEAPTARKGRVVLPAGSEGSLGGLPWVLKKRVSTSCEATLQLPSLVLGLLAPTPLPPLSMRAMLREADVAGEWPDTTIAPFGVIGGEESGVRCGVA